jgi:hypothetical protein
MTYAAAALIEFSEQTEFRDLVTRTSLQRS